MENTSVVDQMTISKKNVLFQVTPFSKTLAAILFIILPFMGFWIGMQYGNTSSETPVFELDNVKNISKTDVPTHIVSSPQTKRIPAASEALDPQSNGFIIMGDDVIYQTVYAKSQIVKVLDTTSFLPLNIRTKGSPLGLLYAKDTNSVVLGDHLGQVLIIAEAEPSTFIVLDQNFARDDKSVFTVVETGGGDSFKPRVVKIPDAHPTTFVVLSSGYAKDKNRVYFSPWNQQEAQIVVDADPSSFNVTNIPSYSGEGYKAKDANSTFDFGKIVLPE